MQNVVIADNAIACDAAVNQARALGYNSLLLSTFVQGEAREVAMVHAGIARQVYWPGEDGAVMWVVESRTKKGWNRFLEHRYLPVG